MIDNADEEQVVRLNVRIEELLREKAALVKALEEIARMTPATSDMTLAHMMGQVAEDALRRQL